MTVAAVAFDALHERTSHATFQAQAVDNRIFSFKRVKSAIR